MQWRMGKCLHLGDCIIYYDRTDNSTLLFTKKCNNACGVHLMNRNYSPTWNAMPQNA
jgi:hypothetical protein